MFIGLFYCRTVMSLFLSVSPSISISHSVSLPPPLFLSPSLHLYPISLRLSIHLSPPVCLSVSRSVSLSVSLPVSLPVSLSDCLSLSVSPSAKCFLDTPVFTGEVEALCLLDPVCDLIVGNIHGIHPHILGQDSRESR